MDNRIVQIYNNGIWVEINFKDLAKDDRFRLFESTGERVISKKGESEWIAACSPFYKFDDLMVNVY